MLFIGYPKGIRGFKHWCIEPRKSKVIISKDVMLSEHHFLLLKYGDGINKPEEDNIKSFEWLAKDTQMDDTQVLGVA